MNNRIRIWIIAFGMVIAAVAAAQAQKVDEQRMQRDLQVAENVLSTLIKQQINQRGFFPIDVEATYLPGFGVTLRLPNTSFNVITWNGGGYTFSDDNQSINQINVDASTEPCEDCPARVVTGYQMRSPRAVGNAKASTTKKKKESLDSATNGYNEVLIKAAKDFITDYGDMLTQLDPTERIVITNRSENRNNWFINGNMGQGNVYLSVEANKADLTSYKQSKLSRDQFTSKIKVVNSEKSDDLSPDLELLSSIFNRLYRPDLSRTFYIQEEVYYERLKDYGVIYDMHVYSSNVIMENMMGDGSTVKIYDMPTIGASGLSKEERYEKVKALYPVFEKNLLDDILEYAKTVKSLKDNEMIIFNVRMTECKGCGIPNSIEASVKESVLKDYSAGKLTKEAALAKIAVKRGGTQ